MVCEIKQNKISWHIFDKKFPVSRLGGRSPFSAQPFLIRDSNKIQSAEKVADNNH